MKTQEILPQPLWRCRVDCYNASYLCEGMFLNSVEGIQSLQHYVTLQQLAWMDKQHEMFAFENLSFRMLSQI